MFISYLIHENETSTCYIDDNSLRWKNTRATCIVHTIRMFNICVYMYFYINEDINVYPYIYIYIHVYSCIINLDVYICETVHKNIGISMDIDVCIWGF